MARLDAKWSDFWLNGQTWEDFWQSAAPPVLVQPTTATLTITGYAPNVAATANVTVTPSTAALVLAGLFPTVTASDHQLVTPTTAALLISAFAPTVTVVGGSASVTPDTAALVLATFAPTVTAGGATTTKPRGGRRLDGAFVIGPAGQRTRVVPTDPQLVTPRAGRLRLTGYAPTVDINDDELATLLLMALL